MSEARTCQYCDSDNISPLSRSPTCSECAASRKRDKRREREDNAPKTCQFCNGTFYGRKRKYCTDDCKRAKKAEDTRDRRANWTDEQREQRREYDRQREPSCRKARICEVCTHEYRPTYNDQRTCGRDCGQELRRREKGTAGGHVVNGQSSDAPLATCVVCRDSHIARLKRPHCKRPKLIVVREREFTACQECGDPLASNKQKYCSSKCSQRASRRHKRHNQRAALATLPPRWTYDPTVYPACQECGGDLTGRQRKWCSDRCRDRAYDRHERHLARTVPIIGEPVPIFTTWQIAERDGWRCHLCNRKVTSLDTASMDHLVPIEDDGVHTPDNVALAHHLCNTLRGSGGQPQLLLSIGL